MRIAIVSDRIGWEEKQIVEHARQLGMEVTWIDDGSLCAGPVGHGFNGYYDTYLLRAKSYSRGLVLAGLIEDAGCRVVNCASAVEICSSKIATGRTLAAHGIATVDFRAVFTRADYKRAIETFGFPFVLKPNYGGFGHRVMLVRDDDLADALYDYVQACPDGLDGVMVAQPFISGSDIRVLAVGRVAVAAIERKPSEDWRANIATGATSHAICIDNELQQLVHNVCACLGADICGVDLFRTADGYVVAEANHTPQFRGLCDATGIDVAHHIVTHLQDLSK